MEEHMKSELFPNKNGRPKYSACSLGTQGQADFAVLRLFLKKHTNFLNQTVAPKCFPC